MSPFTRRVVSIAWFYIGLIITVLGFALVVRAGLGASPWDVFHLGGVLRTGWAISIVINLAGAAIVLINWLMGIPPTLGMILNMLSTGPIMQIWLAVLPAPHGLAMRWATLASAIVVSGIGTGLYVSAGIGSGPRDGMMIGLTGRLGLRMGLVKNLIDVAVAFTGWLLGGPVGIGTVAVALGLGPCMQMGMSIVERLAVCAPFSAFVHPIPVKRAS